jgi:hypothetical protein
LKIALLLILAGLIRCSDEAVVNARPAVLLPVNRIKQVTVAGRSATIVVNCTAPNPCYTLARVEQKAEGNEIAVQVFGRLVSDNPCIQVVASIDVIATFKLPDAGTYHFRFTGYNRAAVDTSLVVD